MVFAKSMKHKKLKRQWFLQNHENIKNCTYLLPAAMPGNNSEPKTWEIIMGEYKAEKQQFQTMVPTCKEHRNLFCAEI
jgi:hypothetical protein